MMTYEKAAAELGIHDMKRIGNNTWLRRKDENTFAVRLHATDVVLIHRDGTYTLNTGGHGDFAGYRTVTTKERINGYSPARVYAIKGTWFLDGEMREVGKEGRMEIARVPFHDGIRVDAKGMVIK